MIDANKEKQYERDHKIVERIELFFRAENTLLKSEWKILDGQNG